MSALTLTLRDLPQGGLDLAPLTPSALAGKSPDQIRRLRLTHGRRSSALADLFEISGQDSDHLRLREVTPACHHIGQAMTAGRLEVIGNAGMELGRAMSGGEIEVKGHAGDGLGLGMRGGVIDVSGDAGERAGGALPGDTRGMNNGTLVIHGNAGARLGERMRRGLIIVGGNTGPHTGDRMIAGSIVVFGQAGPQVGAGMRRGTLMLAQQPARMPATFNDCGEFELDFMPVFARYVATINKRFGARMSVFRRAARWCGDMAYGGKGEVFIARRAE